MKPDRPVDQGTAISFLNSFKKLLIAWGFEKRCVKFDEESHVLGVAGTPVLKATVQDGDFKIKWLDPS